LLRHYEMIFIVHPSVPEEETSKVTDKVTSIINQRKGEVVALKNWGKKKFSYQIRRCTKGYYFLLDFLATPAVLAELERTLRLDEKILRYQTVRSKMEDIEALRSKSDAKQKGEGTPAEE